MNTEDFVAQHYASRAEDYLTSSTHSKGEDLEQIAGELRGCGSASVLDLGCGGGHVSYCASPHVAHVVACDPAASMLAAVAKESARRGLSNISVRQGTAEDLPFADCEFDYVLCRFSVHHWHHMDAGLREARRVLKLVGRAIFVDVIAPADPLLDTHLQAFELLRDPSQVRDYTLAEWVAALSGAGFRVTGMTTRKLRMDFPQWIKRAHTPDASANAIRAAQDAAPGSVRTYYAVGPDGSFDLDTVTFLSQAI
jgi:ubiquinone/menaquinone biosynthesis C-methylase UbiE